MNFEWTPEETELKTRLLGLFDDAAKKNLEAMETSEAGPLKQITLAFLNRLAESGYLNLAVGPESRSGALQLMSLMEALAGVSGSLLLAAESSARLFGGLLAGWGGDTVKSLLDKIMAGEAIGAVAVAEPGGDEPRDGMLTKAEPDGDGYRVSGYKSFVTNGPIADCIAVLGELGGKPAFFLIGPDTPGVTFGDRIPTLGYNGLAVCSLELDNANVPAEHVIGPFDDNASLDYLTNLQDLILSAASVGVITRAHNEANAYSRTHHKGVKPIYAHQEVRFKLADTFTYLQSSQLLCYRSAWFFAQGDREAPILINCAKVFTAEAAETAANLAMQIMAGRGYVSGNPVEKSYREAKYAALAGTTSEISRMNIADDILRRV